nr:hypothetical protein [Clostridia bacterium]
MNPVYLIYTVLTILALIILWALVRCFFKRLLCGLSIRRTCRRAGLTLHAKPLWWLGSRYLMRIDCLIEGRDAVFAVKLFGCLWPLKSLILRERGEYFFRAHSSFLAPLLDIIDGYPHTLPDYRIPEADKEVRPMLLINPMPLEILLQPSSGLERISGPGDQVFGMEIANLSHLLRVAENAGKTK